jgi:hypothetical protein
MTRADREAKFNRLLDTLREADRLQCLYPEASYTCPLYEKQLATEIKALMTDLFPRHNSEEK